MLSSILDEIAQWSSRGARIEKERDPAEGHLLYFLLHTSQRKVNMPWCSFKILEMVRLPRLTPPRGSKRRSRLRVPFRSSVHTSISSWWYAKVQLSPYLQSCLLSISTKQQTSHHHTRSGGWDQNQALVLPLRPLPSLPTPQAPQAVKAKQEIGRFLHHNYPSLINLTVDQFI